MNKLEEIFAWKRQEVETSKLVTPLEDLKQLIANTKPTAGFLSALKCSLHKVSLIAEVKQSSPSAGIIRKNFDPADIAMAYRNAGADCISVLTDEKYFGGNSKNIQICKDSSGLPILRKDFIYDSYQLFEARAWGADAVLLIVAMLEEGQLSELHAVARQLQLDVLVEVHTIQEAKTAITIGAEFVGINNRNLETFLTDLVITEQIAPIFDGRCHIVSESALSSKTDIDRVQAAGANSVLIGTAFCSAANIEEKVHEVMNWR